MTVSQKVQQCIANLKSAQSSLESFALDTQNQNAKQVFQSAAQQCQNLVNSIQSRLGEIQEQEPQYKGM